MKKWTEIVPVKNKVSKYSYVCDLHFVDTDYELGDRGWHLKKTAVPSVFVSKDKKKVFVNIFNLKYV